jgi:uncharacterized delta-60 repeat protein
MPGSLDLTFGGTGVMAVAASPSSTNDLSWGPVVVQSDRKVIAAGRSVDAVGGGLQWMIVRFQEDGTLDQGFGNGGLVLLLPGQSADVRDLAIDSAGRIVAFGWGPTSNWTLVRLQPDGSMDSGFGSGGIVQTGFGGMTDAQARALLLQPDGRILTAGFSPPGGYTCLARYLPNGALDPAFGKKGRALLSLGGERFQVRRGAIGLQAGGRIVLGGSVSAGVPHPDWALLGVTATGALDNTFGNRAVASLSATAGTSHYLWDLCIQPGGEIVTCGTLGTGGSGDVALVRFQANGALDTAFGTGGIALAGAGGIGPFAVAHGHGCALLPDGRIAAGGYGLLVLGGSTIASQARMIAVRFLSSGLPDPGFGVGGIGQIDDPGLTAAHTGYGVAVAPDGKIVVAGGRFDGTTTQVQRTRFGIGRWNGG